MVHNIIKRTYWENKNKIEKIFLGLQLESKNRAISNSRFLGKLFTIWINKNQEKILFFTLNLGKTDCAIFCHIMSEKLKKMIKQNFVFGCVFMSFEITHKILGLGEGLSEINCYLNTFVF